MKKQKLPNKSLEWIESLNAEEAFKYANRFVCYELKEGVLKLTFFLNPYQSYKNHKRVATRKFNKMNELMAFARTEATLVDIDRKKSHLSTYIFNVA